MSASGSASKRQRLSELQAEIDAEEQATVQQLQEEKNAAEEKCRELETDLGIQTMQYESVQQALLFHLPRYSRYSQMKKVILDEGDPTRTFLKQHFKKSVLAHRRRHGEPHKEPPKLKVLRIERIHNPRLQEKYLAEVQDIAGLVERRVTPLDILAPPAAVESYHGLKLNEFLLYHGAPHDIVERLSMQGLDPRYAGENAGKLFGAGSYFAANSSKSDIYTTPNAAGERCILICRVCLGEGSLTKESCPSVTRPPERPDGRGPLNSIVAVTQSNGGCVEHPEFIVFKEAQALPEFAIWYKHRAGCQCTHCYEPPIDFVISFPEATAVDPALADWQCKLRASQKVDDLKKWVLIKFMIPIDDQQITMASANGQPVVLDDDQRTLAHYSVVNGSTLKVSGRPRLVRVLMEELGKDTLVRWMIPIGCTVQAVKKKVVEFCDADENDFVLTYKGHQLPLNWQTLDAAGVRLPAVMRARGIAAIFVKTLTGELLTIHANPQVTSVIELKEWIRDKQGAPPDQQRLVFAGKQMEDGRFLSHYDIVAGSTVHMILAWPRLFSCVT